MANFPAIYNKTKFLLVVEMKLQFSRITFAFSSFSPWTILMIF